MSIDSPSIQSPAPRWRFWCVVFCFLILNGLAWVVYDRTYALRHRGTLRVDAFEPGDNAVVDGRDVVRWRFSDDVLPTTAYGKDPGRVTPAIAGRWAWENPRTLSFVPAVDLPRATPVTFTLASDLLRTGTGAAMKDSYVTSVHSRPLSLESVQQSAAIDDDQFVLELHFNDRVTPGDVLQHLTATLPDGHAVHCRQYGQTAGDIVRLATDTVPMITADEDTKLTVKLSPGLIGVSGPLGLDAIAERTVSLGRKLMATSLVAVAPTRGQSYLTLSFNNSIDIATLKKVLTLDPAIPFTTESDGNQQITLKGDFQPGMRYTAHLAGPLPGTAAAEKSRYPLAGQLAAFMPDKGSDVWFDNDQGYLSTAGNRTVLARAVNVSSMRVSITRMYDNNLVAWRNATDSQQWCETDPFSKPVARRIIPVPGGKNVEHVIPLSLDDLLPGDIERAGVWRIGVSQVKSDDDEDEYGPSSAVVTLSDIGLTAKQTRDGLVAWATSLHTAKPKENVRIRAFSSKNQLLGEAVTDGDGLARLTGLDPAKEEQVAVLLADVVAPATALATNPDTQPATQATTQPSVAASELTWLDLRHTAWELGDSDTSGAAYLRTGHSAFVYTDRGVYRPGETLHLRAIVRGPGEIAPTQSFPVKWQLRRPDERNWKSEIVMLDSDGAAAADVPLPADLPSGQWSASLALPGEKSSETSNEFGSVQFRVEDFIPNRLKLSLALQTGNDKTPVRYTISDAPLDVEVQADYLFGRPGAGLAVDLSNHATPVPFKPTGWDGWTFGDAARLAGAASSTSPQKKSQQLRLIHHRNHTSASPEPTLVSDEQSTEAATLDEHGRYRTSLNVADIVHLPDDSSRADHYVGPWLLTTDAGVRETGGRAVTVSKQITIDALPAYIGVRQPAAATPGQSTTFEVKLAKPDGAPEHDTDMDLQAQLLRETWNTVLVYRDGHYHYDSTRVMTLISSATVRTADGITRWSASIPDSGKFVAVFYDPASGAITTLPFYATDGSGWDENVDRQNPERLDVRVLRAGESEDATTNQKDAGTHWHTGDTARVLIASPFKGQLLLSVETDDVVQSTVVEMTSSHMVVPVKLSADCWPNAFISATVIRAIDPNAKWQTHRAFGITRLNMDSTDRRLQMTLDAPPILQPSQSLDVGIKVTDPEGNAVTHAAITLAAVDEGICTLTDFKTPDPLKFFASRRALGVRSADLFGLLMPEVAKPDEQRDIGGDKSDGDTGRYRSPVGARRVKPVALAWATAHTDGNGFARASFPVPEFQGQLRIIAVGYTPTLLGCADRPVTVRSTILAQSSWPRFAAPGDRFTVPVVLFNNSAVGGDAVVSVALMNDEKTPAGLIGFGTNKSPMLELPPVAIAAGGQQQVNVDVSVAAAVGVAKVRLNVVMGNDYYHEEVELPVRPASPLLQLGGTVRASTTQAVTLSGFTPMMPGTGSIRVNITPWPTFNLPNGLNYLDRYPYGCCEQTTSTCFPLIALGDIGNKIDPIMFDPVRIREQLESGITRLIGLQTAEGGLSMWPGQVDPWPWGSIYAAHFLTEARSAGYTVPDDFYNHLLTYVRKLTDAGTDDANQLELQSYAAYVMTLAGKPDRAILDRLTELASASPRPDDPIDGYAMRSDARLMLACAWLMAGRRDLAEGLLPDAVPVARQNRQLGGNLGSGIRDRALLILAIEQVQPNRPELADLVQQLADQGMNNQWGSTQDVAFSILAIGRYLRDQQKQTPYDSARLMLGETMVAQAQAGNSIDWTGSAAASLRAELTGAANATGHLTWMQTGVPMSPPADAAHGLKIHRRYLTLDGQDITGSVTSGELVRVELTIEAPPDQPNLVIEDLLPAGLEVENPRLETSAKDHAKDQDEKQSPDEIPAFGNGRVDIRDDRVIIAGQMPSTWKARCTYLARAITAGTFTVPPVRCEAMYDLNMNAISGSGKLTVQPLAANIATMN